MKDMKNYKIIENRPELTPDQISQGMNFAAVKSGSTAAGHAVIKSASIKGIVLKTVIGVVLVSTSVLVCYKLTKSDTVNKPEQIITANKETETSKESNVIITPTVQYFTGDSTIEPAREKSSTRPKENHKEPTHALSSNVNATTPSSHNNSAEEKTDTTRKSEQLAKQYTFSEPFKASPNTKCVLLSMDALDNMGSAQPSPITMNCNACEFGYVTMHELEKNPKFKMVWLSVGVNGKSKFNLESSLKNIRLIQSVNGKEINPVAIGIGAPSGNSKESRFISNKFQAIDLKIIFNKQVDLYIIFDEATVGDKIIFNDFIQAQIEE